MDIIKMLRDREALIRDGYDPNDQMPMDLLDMNELACDLVNEGELTRIKLFCQALYVMLAEIREGRLTYTDAEEGHKSEWYSLQEWYVLLGWPFEVGSKVLDNCIFAAQNTVIWLGKIRIR